MSNSCCVHLRSRLRLQFQFQLGPTNLGACAHVVGVGFTVGRPVDEYVGVGLLPANAGVASSVTPRAAALRTPSAILRMDMYVPFVSRGSQSPTYIGRSATAIVLRLAYNG